MRHPDKQLYALLRRMVAQDNQVDRQRPLNDKSLSQDFMVKAGYERDMIDEDVLPEFSPSMKRRRRWLRFAALLGLAFMVQCVWSAGFPGRTHRRKDETVVGLEDLCPQVEALVPREYEGLLVSLDEEFGSSEFRIKAYESLGGAVRIPTESYDDLGLPSEDPRWKIRNQFHEYLESRFPKVHTHLKRIKVNTYALVYEWKGTEDIKPLLLAAHMDVVPVNPATYDDWIHPPYSGYYDGEWIWGRGSCDDKPGVVASLTAVETLLECGFIPSRTVILAFGADEEIGGFHGAAEIAKYLHQTYGPDSMAMIIDEGGGFDDINGTVFAKPSVAEKVYVDVRMDVLTPGGHSSLPPKHTGIGILANLITELEDHPHEPELVRGGIYYQGLACSAKYDTGFPESLRELLSQSQTSDEKLRELGKRLIDFDPKFYVLSGTTQAIDLIGGGVKVNALPEAVWAIANHRVAEHSSLPKLMDRFVDIGLPVATKHNMTLEAFGKMVGSQDPGWGTIRISNTSILPPPVPVTPTVGSGPYGVLSGTLRSTFQTHLRTDDLPKTAIISPGLSPGKTDTVHYWNLTKHIFRYNHRGTADAYSGIHTVNEAIRAEGFLEQIRFFARLILNADRSDLLD